MMAPGNVEKIKACAQWKRNARIAVQMIDKKFKAQKGEC